MVNNLGPVFKIYLIVVNNQMQKNKKLEEDKVLFRAIKEEKTCIKTKHKTFANFATIKSNVKLQRRATNRKKECVKQLKYKKCGCKYLADQVCKHTNKKYDKCHKKKHVLYFHDSYIFLKKKKTLEKPVVSSLNVKKHISCITQVVSNKMFKTGITQKIIANLGTT